MTCKQFEVTIKPGDDIRWTGFIQQQGITDFSDYTLAAEFRAKNINSSQPNSLLGTGTIEWIDHATGTFNVLVPRTVTADWPFGITVMMDISVMDGDDVRVRSETLEFTTAPGVTETM